jgi:hypothetical protein
MILFFHTVAEPLSAEAECKKRLERIVPAAFCISIKSKCIDCWLKAERPGLLCATTGA